MDDFNKMNNEKDKGSKKFDSYEPSHTPSAPSTQEAPKAPEQRYSSLSDTPTTSSFSGSVSSDTIGSTQRPTQSYSAPRVPKKKAVGALVKGIISILFGCYPVGCFIGFFLAISALGSAKKTKADYPGLAKGGKITGTIGLILSILMTIVTIASFMSGM